MATRLRSKQTPAGWDFLRLDSTLTDADRFFSVRDFHIVQQNHNLVVARRIRRPIFTLQTVAINQALTTAARTGNNEAVPVYQEMGLNVSHDYFMEVPIDISPKVDQLELTVDHFGADSVELFCELGTESSPGVPSDTAQLSIAGAGRHVLTMVVPHDLTERGGPAWFRMSLVAAPTGVDLKVTDFNITDAQMWYIEAERATGNEVGTLMYVLNSGTAVALIEPRIVTAVQNVGGTETRYYVSIPYANGEILDTYDINFRAMNRFEPQTISLYELGVTSFFAPTEPPVI